MSYSGEGPALSRFRENTEMRTGKMTGVTFGTFWCKRCDRSRPVLGRKSTGRKNGFICAACAVKPS